MECLTCSLVFLVFAFLFLIIFFLTDCDFTLLYRTKFGKNPKVELKDKVVWITGASSGIGEYLAYELAKCGCRLVLSARRENELQNVKKQCLLSSKLKEEEVLVLKLDMIDFESHDKAVQTILQYFGKIDILVNNAGRSQRGMAAKTSLEVDRQLMELNVMSVLSITKKVLVGMMERKSGHIVVTGSVAGKIGAPFSASYSASKFALQGWFDSLRIEQFENNIDVTMVCPGPVQTDIAARAFTEKPGEAYGKNTAENQVTAERCAELMAVAIANRSYEVWISHHPVLLFTYMAQYIPTLTKKVFSSVGLKTAKKIREGSR